MRAMDFEMQLEVFRQEVDAAIQFFYTTQGISLGGIANADALRVLNLNKPFWMATLAAFQLSTFITLGRIFDPNPANHSVTRLMALTIKRNNLFTRTALSDRKRDTLSGAALENYLDSAFFPDIPYLRKIKAEVNEWRTHYEQTYRELRNRIFAHRDAENEAELTALWSKTDIRQLEILILNLRHLYTSLHELYWNGKQPSTFQGRTSALEMLVQPTPDGANIPLAERCTKAAANVVSTLAEQAKLPAMTREERAIERNRRLAHADLQLELAMSNKAARDATK